MRHNYLYGSHLISAVVANITILICCCILCSSPATATTCLTSQLSHAGGGAIVAGAVTAAASDRYRSEQRGLIGFSVSTVVAIVSEGYQMAKGETFSSSLQDVLANTIGAMIGAIITDKYILAPIVERDSAGTRKIGIVVQRHF